MRQLAISVATVAFFVMALVGWACDVPVLVCGLRALAGAVALYVVVNMAGSAAIRIIVNAALKSDGEQAATGRKGRS